MVSAATTPTRADPGANGPQRRARSTPKGRQPQEADRLRVAECCAGLEPRADLLIEHLHRLQDAEGGLRRGHLAALAERLRLSQAQVHEVATFYHHFEVVDDDTPLPRTVVRVCTGVTCQMAGGTALWQGLQARLGACAEVRVVEAPCMGQCHRAPAACVGQHQMAPASEDRVAAAVAAGQTGPRPLWPQAGQAASKDDYAVLRPLWSGQVSVEQVLAELQAAGLRGLGGAGFPAWRKWTTVRAQPGPRHVVVNIDEGEVGTFKDWHVLSTSARPALEGALVAAWAVEADHVWLYLRDEYHDARAWLQEELARLRAWLQRAVHEGLVQRVPQIELRRGAGAYVCGEESALIESLEGKRGMPRLRPPIVAQRGLHGRPTLAHNLETLWWVPAILRQGGAWWAQQGVRGRVGLRRFSVSGRVNRPGVYLAPAGTTLRELVFDHAGGLPEGHELYAFLPGGASGGILPAALADVPLDFDTLAEHGAFVGSMAVVVLSQHDRVRDVAAQLMRFLAQESCGQCTPCRAGTAQAQVLMEAPVWSSDTLAELSHVMREASICGLGQAAPNVFDSVLRFFPHEVAP